MVKEQHLSGFQQQIKQGDMMMDLETVLSTLDEYLTDGTNQPQAEPPVGSGVHPPNHFPVFREKENTVEAALTHVWQRIG